MHTFIAECDGERVCARYPDNEEADLLEKNVELIYLQETSSLDPNIAERINQRLARENPQHIISDLIAQHPTSYLVPYIIGNALQDAGMHLYSIDICTHAFTNAPHDALKFQAKHREALSWKLLADHYATKTNTCTAFGLALAHAYSQHTLHLYELACLTLDKAREYTTAALPAEAVTYEFNTALYYLAVAYYNYDTRVASAENTEEKQAYTHSTFIPLRLSRAFKELSNQLAKYYTVPGLEEEYEKFDRETERLEGLI